MTQGFDGDQVKIERIRLERRLKPLNELLQRNPPLPPGDASVVSASREAAADYRRMLAALGRELSDAETEEVAKDLRTMDLKEQQRMLGAVTKAERLEARRKKHADGWPSVPLQQGCCLPVCVVWRILRFLLFTLFIDVPAMLGFPVFLGWLRVVLVSSYSIVAIPFVLHWFGMPSSPAAAPAAAPVLSALATARWTWQGIALFGTACVAAVVLIFDKDLTARASAVPELRRVKNDANKMLAKLPHTGLQSLREALKAWADLCNTTHERDSNRLQQIEDKLVRWQWHPFHALWRPVRGCFVRV